MAGFFGTFIIEWECLKPQIHNEEYGFMEWVGRSENDVKEKFVEQNPDYKVISVKMK